MSPHRLPVPGPSVPRRTIYQGLRSVHRGSGSGGYRTTRLIHATKRLNRSHRRWQAKKADPEAAATDLALLQQLARGLAGSQMRHQISSDSQPLACCLGACDSVTTFVIVHCIWRSAPILAAIAPGPNRSAPVPAAGARSGSGLGQGGAVLAAVHRPSRPHALVDGAGAAPAAVLPASAARGSAGSAADPPNTARPQARLAG